jgi:hypothetical protein
MAITLQGEDINTLVARELSERARYRCLVLQSSDMNTLQSLREAAIAAVTNCLGQPQALRYADFFDNVGALSCNDVCIMIDDVATTTPVILVGPLHFLDYWTETIRSVFWNFLSTYSKGPGIVVIDSPRLDSIEGPFRVAGQVGGSRVRYLRSRLAVS